MLPVIAKVIIEKSHGGRFLWNRNRDNWAGFGLVRQLLRPVFSCFHGEKKFKTIVDDENIFGIE